jgi:hypothetical protein
MKLNSRTERESLSAICFYNSQAPYGLHRYQNSVSVKSQTAYPNEAGGLLRVLRVLQIGVHIPIYYSDLCISARYKYPLPDIHIFLSRGTVGWLASIRYDLFRPTQAPLPTHNLLTEQVPHSPSPSSVMATSPLHQWSSTWGTRTPGGRRKYLEEPLEPLSTSAVRTDEESSPN